jgi:5-methylcytosine-specific restriction protein A
MNIPPLERVERHREYDAYSTLIRSQVVYSYLFKGLSRRALDREIIGLDPDKSKGWQSMGILHYIGLKKNHKNIFKGLDFNTVLIKLKQINTDDSKIILEHLLEYSTSSKQLDKEVFDRKFEKQISESIKIDKKVRDERLKQITAVKPEKVEVVSMAFKRNADVVATVLDRANGICELCKQDAPFLRAKDNSPYLEVHHKVKLADGGNDTVENAIAVCPNCHRKLHHGQ